MTDREKFLSTARSYIGKDGQYVCLQKLRIGFICDWCAFSVSSIMRDCGFIRKYIKEIEGGAGTIPRYSDGKFGTWFKKGTKAPQAGDLFFLRYSDYPTQDKYFCDHIGIVESVSGNIITTLEGNVDGWGNNWAETSSFKRKTRYLSDYIVYAFYRPYWQNETKSTGTDSKTNTSTARSIDAIYQVHTAGGSWLPKVRNLEDYAGLENRAIDGILVDLTSFDIRYRVHLLGGVWLPWVINCSEYAGIYGRKIDAVQMEFINIVEDVDDIYTVEYRVSTTGSTNYLPWVKGYNNINDDGYAGIIGKPIDKLQVRVVKK